MPRPTKFTAVENRAHFDTVRGEKIQVLLKEEAEAADTQAKAEDTFQNIAELISRLPDSTLPEKVEKVLQDDKAFLLKVALQGKPSIEYSIVFDQSLSCKIWFRDDKVLVSDLLENGKTTSDTKLTSFKSMEKLFVILENKKKVEKSREEKVEQIIEEIQEL